MNLLAAIRVRLPLVVGCVVALAWVLSPVAAAADARDDLEEAGNPCDNTAGQITMADQQQLVPTDCIKGLPSHGFDVGYDEGAWNHLSRKITGTMTGMAFDAARGVTSFAIWVLEWAYGFGAGQMLRDPVVTMIESFETKLIGPLDVGSVMFGALIFWVAITSLRGKTAHAFGELVVSLVMVGVFGIIMANPSGYMDGAFDTTGRLSGIVLAAARGQELPDTAEQSAEVVQPIRETIHETFVEVPYDLLNWGTVSFPDACKEVRDLAVASGPHGTDDEPRVAMADAGCNQLDDFNNKPTGTRMVGAVMAAVAAVLLGGLIALVALTVIVAQVVMALIFAVLPFAAAASVLPGGGRTAAIKWATSILRAMLAVIAMSFLLAVMLLLVTAILEVGPDGAAAPLYARYAGVIASIGGAIVARKRILAAGETFTGRLSAAASTARPGAGGGGRGSPGAASGQPGRANGISGMNVVQHRPGAQPSRTGQMAARSLERRHRTRSYAKANAKTAAKAAPTGPSPLDVATKPKLGSRMSGGKGVGGQGRDGSGGWRTLPAGKEPKPDGKIPSYRRNRDNVAGRRDPRSQRPGPSPAPTGRAAPDRGQR